MNTAASGSRPAAFMDSGFRRNDGEGPERREGMRGGVRALRPCGPNSAPISASLADPLHDQDPGAPRRSSSRVSTSPIPLAPPDKRGSPVDPEPRHQTAGCLRDAFKGSCKRRYPPPESMSRPIAAAMDRGVSPLSRPSRALAEGESCDQADLKTGGRLGVSEKRCRRREGKHLRGTNHGGDRQATIILDRFAPAVA
jgi:hypothetical protein